MPYQEHPHFIKPDNPDTKIWRYMDFSKFVSILNNECLYFSRGDMLGDPYEGTYSKANSQIRPYIYKDMSSDYREKVFNTLTHVFKSARAFTYVNCWHINQVESDAMWKLYLKSGEGIAIQSTYSRLVKSLQNSSEIISIGKVTYIDYLTEWMPEGSLIYPFIHKQKCFEHENELRALFTKYPENGEMLDFSMTPFHDGFNIKVNIKELIEGVFIAPTSLGWMLELMKDLIRKYGFNFEVFHSQLSEPPIFY